MVAWILVFIWLGYKLLVGLIRHLRLRCSRDGGHLKDNGLGATGSEDRALRDVLTSADQQG